MEAPDIARSWQGCVMAEQERPKHLRFSHHRRTILDLLHFARKVPLQPLTRVCQLADVAALRATTSPRISWTALLMKAHGLVARAVPELRQAFLPWPRPKLYQHPHSVCALTISREVDGVPCLFFPLFLSPETMPLRKIQGHIDEFANRPVWDVARYRRQIRASLWPTLVRRVGWWMSLNLSGFKRAKRFGTFGLTSVAGQGAITPTAYSPLTTTLTNGPLDDAGRCPVTLVYDHRIMDGLLVSRCLAGIEDALRGVLSEEMATLTERREVA
jgi:hypothetical protein